MGKINCRCGNQLSDVAQPNSFEGVLVSTYSAEWSPVGAVEHGRQIWECDECGALIVQLDQGELRHYASPDGRAISLFKLSG